jgi:hypothetical protein
MFHSGHRTGQSIDRVLIFEGGETEGQIKNKVISNGCPELCCTFFIDRVLIEVEMCHQPLTATSDQRDQK